MILGQYQAKVTEKERISVPAKFRKELGRDIVVARWYEGCLVLVSKQMWTAFIDRLTGSKGIITKPTRSTDRFILGSAFDVKIDKLGRFVLPKLLKKYANIKEQVMFVGLGDRVEIWDKSAWDKEEEKVAKSAEVQLEKIAKESK